jgi:hypothetical protein
MGEKSSEIIDEIETSRNKLGENLSDLESRIREAANWRTHYERHPYVFMGAALGGGLLLSRILLGGRGSNGATVRHDARHQALARERGPAAEILDKVKSALVVYGAAKVKELLREILPGFQETESF